MRSDVEHIVDASQAIELRSEGAGALTASTKESPIALPAPSTAYWSDPLPRSFVVVVDITTTDDANNAVEVYGGTPMDINATTLLSVVPAGATGLSLRSVTTPAGFDRITVRGVVAGARLDYSARLYVKIAG